MTKLRRALDKIQGLLRKKVGMTLLEMMLGLALTAIIFTSVAALMPAMSKSYFVLMDISHAKLLANNVADAVKSELTYAEDISVDGSGKFVSYTLDGAAKTLPDQGRSSGLGIPVIHGLAYDENYYMGDDLELRFSYDEGSGICAVEIKISKAEEELYSMTREFCAGLGDGGIS